MSHHCRHHCHHHHHHCHHTPSSVVITFVLTKWMSSRISQHIWHHYYFGGVHSRDGFFSKGIQVSLNLQKYTHIYKSENKSHVLKFVSRCFKQLTRLSSLLVVFIIRYSNFSLLNQLNRFYHINSESFNEWCVRYHPELQLQRQCMGETNKIK